MNMQMPAPDAASSVPSRFDVAPYQPDGGYEPAGVAMLISALAIAGAILGFAAHWISQYFYLILAFPMGIGFLLGAVGMRMSNVGRVRNPWIGGLAGFAGGVLAMFMMHYFDYRDFRSAVDNARPEIREIFNLSAQEQAEMLNGDLNAKEREELRLLFHMGKVQSMLDYMNFAAEQGVEINRTGSGKSGGMNLGFVGSYIYWIVEVLIVAGFTLAMVRGSAAEPYCRDCGQWKQTKVLGMLGGDPSALIAAANAGDLDAVNLAKGADITGPLRITAACCDGCVGQGSVDIRIDLISHDGKRETAQKKAHVTYPANALPRWAGICGSAVPAESTA